MSAETLVMAGLALRLPDELQNPPVTDDWVMVPWCIRCGACLNDRNAQVPWCNCAPDGGDHEMWVGPAFEPRVGFSMHAVGCPMGCPVPGWEFKCRCKMLHLEQEIREGGAAVQSMLSFDPAWEKAERRAGRLGPPGRAPLETNRSVPVLVYFEHTGTPDHRAAFLEKVEKELRLQFTTSVKEIRDLGDDLDELLDEVDHLVNFADAQAREVALATYWERLRGRVRRVLR